MTLLECLSYLALSAILSVILFRWWVIGHEHIARLSRVTADAVQERLLYQIVMRDMQQANPEISDWQADQNQLRFMLNQDHITYRFSKGAFTRTVKRPTMLRASSATIARSLQQVSWQVIDQAGLVRKVIVIAQGDLDQKRWIFPLKKGSYV